MVQDRNIFYINMLLVILSLKSDEFEIIIKSPDILKKNLKEGIKIKEIYPGDNWT